MNAFEAKFVWDKLCASLGETLPEDAMTAWKENFSLLDMDRKGFVLGYKDEDAYKMFVGTYMNAIYDAAFALSGKISSIKFKKVTEKVAAGLSAKVKKAKKAKKEKPEEDKPVSLTGKKGSVLHVAVGALLALVCILLAVALLLVGWNYAQNTAFAETFYSVNSAKVQSGFRVIQLSDLHNSRYGKNNEKLIHRIEVLQPDIIVLTGDILDEKGSEAEILTLCGALCEIAPTYYIYGNNEEMRAFANDMTLTSLDDAFGFNGDNRDPEVLYAADNGLRASLEATGVTVLFNETATLTVGKDTVDVFGLLNANPSAFWEYAGTAFTDYSCSNTKNFKLFLSHEPFLFEELDGESYGDLILCGHTHGGLADLPVLGRLYAPGYGLFPERGGHYVAGAYTYGDGTPLIVSTGLTNKGAVRIDNRPELVIVDVARY